MASASGVTVPVDDVRAGVAAMFAAIAVLSLQDVVGKELATDYPVVQTLAIRAVLALAVIVVVVHRTTGLRHLRTAHLGSHVVRSGCMLGAFLLYYRALRDLPLADATAIFFGAPLFMCVLSRLLLHEEIGRARLGALLAGFAGVLVVVRPVGDGFEPAALLVLAGSVLYPLAMVTTRSLSRHDSTASMLLWLFAFQTVVAGAAVPFVWEAPDGGAWLLLLAMAGMTLLGHLGLAFAFGHSPVAVLAPIEYSALVFAAAFGWLVWGEVPAVTFWLGAPVIVASSVAALLADPARARA